METIKKIISKDGKHRLDIDRSPDGLYRYVTFDDRYRNDPDFHQPPEWTIDAFSGLYESAEALEADAIATFLWLREQPCPLAACPANVRFPPLSHVHR